MLIATINMQGGNKWAETLSATKDADFICLQECGSLPSAWNAQSQGNSVSTAFVNLGTEMSMNYFHVVHYEFGNTNDRCSLAVLGRPATGKWNLVSHTNAGLRPLIGLEASNGAWVYSIHAPSGNHNAAAGVAKSLIGKISQTSWVVAGDYNCPPSKMGGSGGTVVASGTSTQQSGNELDYIVHSNNLKGEHKKAFSVGSDHWGQRFDVT